jgi:hypothetical protein
MLSCLLVFLANLNKKVRMPVPFEVNFKRTLGKQLKEEDFRQQFFKTHGGLTSF